MASTVEVLKRLLFENEENQEEALAVDTKHSVSTKPEIITTNETDYALVSVPAGKHIIVTGVHIEASGNVGEIDVDLEDGTPVERLYSSNKTSVSSLSESIHGSDGGNLLFTGDGSTDEIFVVINYKIHS